MTFLIISVSTTERMSLAQLKEKLYSMPRGSRGSQLPSLLRKVRHAAAADITVLCSVSLSLCYSL